MNNEQTYLKNENLVYSVYRKHFCYTKLARALKDDLIQEGKLALWKCVLGFNPDKNVQFSTYAYTAIKRAMANYLNKEYKHVKVTISLDCYIYDSDTQLKDVIPDESTQNEQEEFTLRKELLSIIQQVYDSCKDNAKQIFDLWKSGKTQDEIASILGISQGQVSRVLKEFKQACKNKFKSDKEV